MFKNQRDRLRDRTIEFGGVIQAPVGAGKSELIHRYLCIVDGDHLISNHYGTDLHVAITLLTMDKESQEIIRSKFLRHIAGNSIILTSIKPELIGLVCGARYAYHACQYHEILSSRGIETRLTNWELIGSVLSYDKTRTYFMERDEVLADYLDPLLVKYARGQINQEGNEDA